MSANPIDYKPKPRRLIPVLGDQLNRDSAVFDDSDPQRDAVVMLEVAEEAEYVPQHKLRLTLFFSAMRHFRDLLRDDGWKVYYTLLDDRNNRGNLADELGRWLNKTRAECVMVCRPGDYRVLRMIEKAIRATGCMLDLREDRHFYSEPENSLNMRLDARRCASSISIGGCVDAMTSSSKMGNRLAASGIMMTTTVRPSARRGRARSRRRGFFGRMI